MPTAYVTAPPDAATDIATALVEEPFADWLSAAVSGTNAGDE